MKIIYNGPAALSPEVKVSPASYLSLPRGEAIEIDEETVGLLLKADPDNYTLAEETLVSEGRSPSTKKGATP